MQLMRYFYFACRILKGFYTEHSALRQPDNSFGGTSQQHVLQSRECSAENEYSEKSVVKRISRTAGFSIKNIPIQDYSSRVLGIESKQYIK